MGRKQILETLKSLKNIARKKYKAELKGVFGSFARGEETDISDIDIMVEFNNEATLIDLVGLENYLEEKLHRKVDVVSKRAIRKELESSIYNDMVAI